MLASLGASTLRRGSCLHANPPGWVFYYRIRAYGATLSIDVGKYRSRRVSIGGVAAKRLHPILKSCNVAKIEAWRLVYCI